MNDRELLELAAKAAGIDYDKSVTEKKYRWGLWLNVYDEPTDSTRRSWNPITDDGDALRLVVKLNLGLVHGWESFEEQPLATVWISHDGQCLAEEIKGNDPYAATRRAIVMAAAEIGKGMK